MEEWLCRAYIHRAHTPVMYFLTTEKIFKGGKRLFMYSCANKDRAWGRSNRVSIGTFRRLVFFLVVVVFFLVL